MKGLVVNPLVLTHDRLLRIQRAETEVLVSRVSNLRIIPGNPLGARVRRFGDATAVMLTSAQRPLPNRVLELRAEDVGEIDNILGWYAAHDAPVEFEIVPFSESGLVQRRLAQVGFGQGVLQSVTAGMPLRSRLPAVVARTGALIDVREVEAGPYAHAMFAVQFGHDAPLDAEWLAIRRAEFLGWRRYVAYVDELPVAYGALFVTGDIAVCGAAMTAREYRQIGCQRALLQRRLMDAAEMGCEMVISGAVPGTTSERNQARMGLTLVYHKAIWMRMPGSV